MILHWGGSRIAGKGINLSECWEAPLLTLYQMLPWTSLPPPLIVMMAMMVTMTMMAMSVRLHPSGEDQTARSTDVILDTPHHDDGHDDDDVDEDLSEWRRPDC